MLEYKTATEIKSSDKALSAYAEPLIVTGFEFSNTFLRDKTKLTVKFATPAADSAASASASGNYLTIELCRCWGDVFSGALPKFTVSEITVVEG